MEKVCISCGMPMSKEEHFFDGDTSLEYCIHCSNEDGSMRSYEDTLTAMTSLMIKTQGLSEESAGKVVKEMMSRLPAWKDVQ